MRKDIFDGHNLNNNTMSRVFRVTPKRIKRTNGQVLTPDMSVVVTTKTHATFFQYKNLSSHRETIMTT